MHQEGKLSHQGVIIGESFCIEVIEHENKRNNSPFKLHHVVSFTAAFHLPQKNLLGKTVLAHHIIARKTWQMGKYFQPVLYCRKP